MRSSHKAASKGFRVRPMLDLAVWITIVGLVLLCIATVVEYGAWLKQSVPDWSQLGRTPRAEVQPLKLDPAVNIAPSITRPAGPKLRGGTGVRGGADAGIVGGSYPDEGADIGGAVALVKGEGASGGTYVGGRTGVGADVDSGGGSSVAAVEAADLGGVGVADVGGVARIEIVGSAEDDLGVEDGSNVAVDGGGVELPIAIDEPMKLDPLHHLAGNFFVITRLKHPLRGDSFVSVHH